MTSYIIRKPIKIHILFYRWLEVWFQNLIFGILLSIPSIVFVMFYTRSKFSRSILSVLLGSYCFWPNITPWTQYKINEAELIFWVLAYASNYSTKLTTNYFYYCPVSPFFSPFSIVCICTQDTIFGINRRVLRYIVHINCSLNHKKRSRGRKYCGNKVTIVVRKTIKPEKRIVFVIHILGSFFPFDIYFLSFSLPNISSPYYPFYNRKRCLIRRKT